MKEQYSINEILNAIDDLQNLKKENRNIIIPSTGKELFYIDYSQFEASILAHCSADKVLLKHFF